MTSQTQSQKLPDTCPSPASQSQSSCCSQPELVKSTVPWGYLFPNRPCVSWLAFTDEQYLIGRAPKCNLVLRDEIEESLYAQLSKEHFRIRIAPISSSSDLMVVQLYDLSFNGTYINGKKIGKGKNAVLRNNDKISLAMSSFEAFIYMDNEPDIELRKYPQNVHNSFAISRKLGSGAYADVHLVFDKRTGEGFAMKIVQKNKFLDGCKPVANHPERLQREVKILKRLSHPFVIRFHDVIDHADNLFLIVELVRGGDLFSLLQKEKLKEGKAKFIFYQLALAVRYLHSRGIIHRDIKLENILLSMESGEPRIKLADFGLSKFLDSQSLLKTHCGTPMYMAPEILKSEGRPGSYDAQVDVWSMGVVLYMCLSGIAPFLQGDKNQPLSTQILRGYYTFPRKFWKIVSHDAHNIIKRMLVVDPQKRFTIAKILDHPWIAKDSELKSKVGEILKYANIEPLEGSQGKENVIQIEDEEIEDGPRVKRARMMDGSAHTISPQPRSLPIVLL